MRNGLRNVLLWWIPIQTGLFCILQPRGAIEAPLYNFKTAHDTGNKISQSNELIISNVQAYSYFDWHNNVI